MDASVAWISLLGLGALHGVNPAMGWLFAVSLGLQERRRGAVLGALGPLALGHALAIAAVVALAALLGLVVPRGALKWITTAALLGFGVAHLLRHRHPRWGGMRVGAWDLTVWSFLMASAHGAGVMALPLVLGLSAPAGHAHHAGAPALAGLDAGGLLASGVHTAGYLLVAGAVALVVYEKLGLRLLRSAWINLDLMWAGALVATALLTPLL